MSKSKNKSKKLEECERRLFLISLVQHRLMSYLPAIVKTVEDYDVRTALDYVIYEIREIGRLYSAPAKYINGLEDLDEEEV